MHTFRQLIQAASAAAVSNDEFHTEGNYTLDHGNPNDGVLILWEPPQEQFTVGGRPKGRPSSEVHVWRVALNCSSAVNAIRTGVLSCSERERADRFLNDATRSRWIIAHGALRLILARYAGTPVDALHFGVGDYGKPELIGRAAGIAFNLTHTGDVALVAVGHAVAVGVDAEIIRPINWRELSESFFAPTEAANIAALPPGKRLDGFYACWVRKEAFSKAVGSGLSIGLDKFSVEVEPNAQPRLLAAPPGYDPEQWYFHDLTEPGVAAALVVKGLKPVVWRYDFSWRLPPRPGH